ncbi:MAG: M48 family metallopeptidase [Gemmatimonadota bacterium]|jgi:Zn-dependent protease with chaperone function|nr:M48 family metallopeptidase [Gemmatimonadota bacterium]
MDFFQAQEAARRRTAVLVALFVAAVIGIILVIYAVAHIAIGPEVPVLDPALLLWVTAGVLVVVLAGSGIRTASLRQGGAAVSELLGGRRVQPDTTDVHEHRLLNVVEEMALASGVAVPAVYVVDGEEGINAFAAGYSLNDASVTVTRGALLAFNRDEMQGVIAHEFSHILNGDMRLNIRLIGTLYGILLLSVIGRILLQFGPRGRSRNRDNNGGNAVILIAIALLVVGYVGVFFGRLIKAAVSRQREYLADSSAVEFTRNPDGLASALKKIATAPYGSEIRNPHAEELSHLFFADGLKASFFGMLATHPSLDERIRRLDPTWEGVTEDGAGGRDHGGGSDHIPDGPGPRFPA